MVKTTRSHPIVKRRGENLHGDPTRVITRLFFPENPERITRIIQRVLDLSDETAVAVLEQVLHEFSSRHQDLMGVFDRHMHKFREYLPADAVVSKTKEALIGAYFTMEYSVESAALFNPSMIPHPDQSQLPDDCLRFIMSLRATGEGHLSSIVFRSGVLDANNDILFDPLSDYVVTPDVYFDPEYDLSLFHRKLAEIGADNEVALHLLHQLPETFSYRSLSQNIETLRENPLFSVERQNRTFDLMLWLADSNYEVYFDQDHPISERVIFPTSKIESRGIEDARFVQFFNDDGESIYYGTYTAYNGVRILPQLIETKDFVKFKVSTLNGKAVQNKGLALFPRKIQDRYVMLSRQDGENNRIMFSDNIHFWHESQIIQEPTHPWEFVQLGNCGSPLETHAGWLVLTHGVGPMRQYCIGAMLLDLDDPTRVIAHLAEPLLAPHEGEREGYVPNVVYSCGSLIHNHELVIPFAMSDDMSGIATVRVSELLDAMQPA